MLTLPSSAIEKLDQPEDISAQSFISLLHVYSMYEGEFQDYLIRTISGIPTNEYDKLVEMLDNTEQYDGPDELKKFLEILNKQGYYLASEPEYGYITVKADYEELMHKLKSKGFSEAHLSVVDFFAKQNNINWSEWHEMDDYLLELESLIDNHYEEYDEGLLRELFMYMDNYLDQYLRTWDGLETVTEQEKEEYQQFLKNHPDSVYWGFINSIIIEWEENEWRRHGDYIFTDNLRFLFDERFQNVKYEDIIRISTWPYTSNTGATYRDYSSSLDSNLLTNLKPLEIVSLYAYSYEKEDNNTSTSLLSTRSPKEELFDDWFEIRNVGGIALTDFTSDNSAVVSFVNWEREIIISVELVKEAGVWKIIQ
ncbi:hypothetical protein [Ornithinibacillus californiensis]|uniref:hypothetical protein n=1 Tax=Ornithinibacillus californiensis TaxID=161536 RepID=UPI00064D9CB1|nr:hypothetical protein [Ornithinibacillus californiensis]